ncbi:MAG: cytochrome b/b6 domain-containing protein [Actinomycetota bacterium]
MGAVHRNNRRTRLLHAGVYLTTFVLLATGWWLLAGKEGDPSALATMLDAPDTRIHEWAGYALAALSAIALAFGLRAAGTFVLQSVRFERGDLGWFARWPAAVFTGRFGRHTGHFDPGQRIANVVMVGALIVLIVSGIGLVVVSGGTAFVWFLRLHKWSTYVLTPVVAGHVLVALGILPGYRGVWRAMHLSGHVPEQTARRLWPAWAERKLSQEEPTGATPPPRTG